MPPKDRVGELLTGGYVVSEYQFVAFPDPREFGDIASVSGLVFIAIEFPDSGY